MKQFIRNLTFPFLLVLLISICTSFSSIDNDFSPIEKNSSSIVVSDEKELFTELNIKDLSFEAFQQAYIGFKKLQLQNKLNNSNLLTIIDFTKPSTQKRLYIIDISEKKLIERSLVAHGRNSGSLNANSFSNTPQSYQSSLGFYLTAETYYGKHGYSLRLDGLEKNINDNARDRAIVIHGADYVSESFIEKYGRLGRSFGCPALPKAKSKAIIDVIKNKSCLFIYSASETYAAQSNYLQPTLASN